MKRIIIALLFARLAALPIAAQEKDKRLTTPPTALRSEISSVDAARDERSLGSTQGRS